MLLITGCPRSGTRYVSSLLVQSGVRAFHEKMGRDGTVSCLFAVDDFWYPGGHQERPSQLRFDHVFHMVRHPLAAVASLALLERKDFWHWTQLHTGLRYEEEGPLRHAAKFWLRWNELVEKLNPEWTFRVESDFWAELCERIGLGLRERPDVRRHESSHPAIGWESLEELAPALQRAAERYGYKE